MLPAFILHIMLVGAQLRYLSSISLLRILVSKYERSLPPNCTKDWKRYVFPLTIWLCLPWWLSTLQKNEETEYDIFLSSGTSVFGFINYVKK